MCVNFSFGHKNTIASTQQLLYYSAKQAHPHPLLCVRVSAKSYLARVRKNISSRQRARFVGPFEKMPHTSRLDSTTGSKTRADPGENSLHSNGLQCADHGTYSDSVLREIYDAFKSARSTPSNCDGRLADHVLKRQPDLATNMTSEQASLSLKGYYEQSTILQLSLVCICQAVEPIIEFVSIRVRSMHSDDNQTLSRRDVGPTAHDGVWAIIDDGCNSCSHSEVWRKNAEAAVKVLVFILPYCTKGRQLSKAQEGAQRMERLKFPWALLCEHVPFSVSSFQKFLVANGCLRHFIHAYFFGPR